VALTFAQHANLSPCPEARRPKLPLARLLAGAQREVRAPRLSPSSTRPRLRHRMGAIWPYGAARRTLFNPP